MPNAPAQPNRPDAAPTPALLDLALPPRRHPLEKAGAWLISCTIHSLILVLLMLFTWPGGGRSAPAGGTEVGIIAEAPSATRLSALPPAPASDSTLQLPTDPLLAPDTLDYQQFQQLASPETLEPEPFEPVIGAESTGNGPQDSQQLWSGLEASTGAATGTASFFGLKAQGSKFVFVVDRSGSMRGPKLQAAKDELIRSLRGLAPNMKFYIFFYDESFMPMPSDHLVPADEHNRAFFEKWIKGIPSGGGTNPAPAMAQALRFQPDAIWLLSDGLFPPYAADLIRNENPNAHTQIHSIAFYDNRGEPILRKIAEENRGHYRFVPPAP